LRNFEFIWHSVQAPVIRQHTCSILSSN
jgi:hypothetical protein